MHFLIGLTIVLAAWSWLTSNGSDYRPLWRFLRFCVIVFALFIAVVLFIIYFGPYFPSL